MVRGLDRFRDHFRDFTDRYVLIGGTACDLVMSDVGLQFRATKDLDIVLCIEALNAEFARAFWAFVKAGQYELQEAATGEKRYYRFQKPADAAYPAMLELFSRVPEALAVDEGSHLTPIPVDDAVSSLSAILLDDAYYGWIHAGKQVIGGVPIVGSAHLIPLKAKAWLDLTARAAVDEHVDRKVIRKHRNDVFRLFQVIDADARPTLPEPIAQDMQTFLERMATETVDLKALGLGTRTLLNVIEQLRTVYIA
jgi:hypothetical protein